MAVIVHNTNYEMKGPWLLDREQLLELDRIISQHWDSLLRYREQEIEEEVEKEINDRKKDARHQSADDREKIHQRLDSSYLFFKEKRLTLSNADGTQIKTNDFTSIMQHPDIEDRIVKGFSYTIKCAGIECQLILRSYNSTITLDVSPGTVEEARSLFVAIKGWLNRTKAPLWQRIVRREWIYGTWWLVFAYALFMGIPLSSHEITPEWEQLKHAHNLLKNGIGDNEVKDSVATTLAIISEYDKPKSHIVLSCPSWYVCLLIAIFFLCLILTILPKIVFGIGKSERSIICWRRWLHFISYTIPIIILSSFVWPWIVDWVKSFF
jgi:hypothetical protein